MQDPEAAAALKDGMISISSFFLYQDLSIYVFALVSFERKPSSISCDESSEDKPSFKPRGGVGKTGKPSDKPCSLKLYIEPPCLSSD